jgi:transposase
MIIPQLAAENLVFLDETSLNTAMMRLYGRAKRGEKLVEHVPYRRFKSVTFLMGLRHDSLIAPFVIEGAMTGATFTAYLDQQLIPLLKPTDIVIMDNLPAHKIKEVRAVFNKHKIAYMFLPPYSPDFNPIEMSFSKLKAILRKESEKTIPELEKAVVKAMDSFSKAECENFLKNIGYVSTY